MTRLFPFEMASRRALLGGFISLAACGSRSETYSRSDIRARLDAFAAQSARLPAVAPVARSAPPPALRALSETFVGTCFLPDQSADPTYEPLIARQFSQITPEWNFQLPAVMKDDGSYDWSWPDQIAAFARRNRQRIHGTSLVWHQLDDVPAFQRLADRPAAFAGALNRHILTIMRRYAETTRGWDVVNEPFNWNGEAPSDSLWSRTLGPEDYMVRAFEAAAEADTGAVLFINEYNLEIFPRKRAAFMRLVDRLRQRGCAVGGVGTQTHLFGDTAPGLVTAAIRDLGTLGLPVHISEFDIKFGPAGRTPLTRDQTLDIQKGLADETLAAFLSLPAAQRYAFTVWGARDKDSFHNRASNGGDGSDAPVLFDDYGAPKPAFWAVADRLAASG